MARIVTFGLGGYDPTKPNNNIIEDIEVPEPPQEPLDQVGVLATLNVVLGLWSVEDAANALGLTPEQLVAEAQAWHIGSLRNGD